MTDTQKMATPEEKQAQMKRVITILVVGVLAVFMFFYMANGVTSLLDSDIDTGADDMELNAAAE